jgi:hypothetical protein
MHRFIWDLRYAPPGAVRHEYPISAIVHDTPREPLGPLVLPGQYTVKLTIGERVFSEPLTVKMDPRVSTPREGLERQLTLAHRVWDLMNQDYAALEEVRNLRKALAARGADPHARELEKKVAEFENFAQLNNEMARLLEIIESADAAPTTQAAAAVDEVERAYQERLRAWRQLLGTR